MHSWSTHPVTMQRARQQPSGQRTEYMQRPTSGPTAAAEPSTHPTPFPNQPYLGVELPRHRAMSPSTSWWVPLCHRQWWIEWRRGRQTWLSSRSYPRSHRKHSSSCSPQDLEQPDYWPISVLKCHTCSLCAFSSIQAGKLCWRKEELLEYFCFLCSGQVMSDSFATPWTVAHQAPLSMGFPR